MNPDKQARPISSPPIRTLLSSKSQYMNSQPMLTRYRLFYDTIRAFIMRISLFLYTSRVWVIDGTCVFYATRMYIPCKNLHTTIINVCGLFPDLCWPLQSPPPPPTQFLPIWAPLSFKFYTRYGMKSWMQSTAWRCRTCTWYYLDIDPSLIGFPTLTQHLRRSVDVLLRPPYPTMPKDVLLEGVVPLMDVFGNL